MPRRPENYSAAMKCFNLSFLIALQFCFLAPIVRADQRDGAERKAPDKPSTALWIGGLTGHTVAPESSWFMTPEVSFVYSKTIWRQGSSTRDYLIGLSAGTSEIRRELRYFEVEAGVLSGAHGYPTTGGLLGAGLLFADAGPGGWLATFTVPVFVLPPLYLRYTSPRGEKGVFAVGLVIKFPVFLP